MPNYHKTLLIAQALDPIHVGAGGSIMGRVDLTIVRDPVTRIPKIPGSSLAGVYRTYLAMAETERNPNRTINGKPWPTYPHCAGLGFPRGDYLGHCGTPTCPVCVIFGFARGSDQSGGFAGLAAFTDAHILLFPVPTQLGPYWVTSPSALRPIYPPPTSDPQSTFPFPPDHYTILVSPNDKIKNSQLNLGWLLLPTSPYPAMPQLTQTLSSRGVPNSILDHIAIVPDDLLPHLINTNLEVRTSVSIDPETGTAEEGALYIYEAIPHTTILTWEIITKNPALFKIQSAPIQLTLPDQSPADTPDKIFRILTQAHPYLEHLGLGGMSNRGMGRLLILPPNDQTQK
ncbi:MAG: RAMP superfamily CRISPR-associated protein [Methylacidiphilales bacterium]|nr:RAMP superfamily CRISPR-associated protein [Candidatus Methylacidiphilales bacterium]MDW8350236.1 RAMP superfamily CRISPR-associated protein [Verrucomicrobiae bacterium]